MIWKTDATPYPENNVMHLSRGLEELNARNGVEYDIIEEGD